MTQDSETIDVYNAQAAKYADMVDDFIDPRLKVFADNLPENAHVLDLGCGPGHAAAYFQSQGHSVTATDASPEMAATALAKYGLTVKIAVFEDLTETDIYDAVWASFSLLHAPKSQMPAHLAAIHRALRPGGTLCLGLKLGKGEHRDGIGRFYAYYTEPELTGLLHDAGFTITERITGKGTGLDGQTWPHIVVTAHG